MIHGLGYAHGVHVTRLSKPWVLPSFIAAIFGSVLSCNCLFLAREPCAPEAGRVRFAMMGWSSSLWLHWPCLTFSSCGRLLPKCNEWLRTPFHRMQSRHGRTRQMQLVLYMICRSQYRIWCLWTGSTIRSVRPLKMIYKLVCRENYVFVIMFGILHVSSSVRPSNRPSSTWT